MKVVMVHIAWENDPCLGLSVSRVDPLPYQLEAVNKDRTENQDVHP